MLRMTEILPDEGSSPANTKENKATANTKEATHATFNTALLAQLTGLIALEPITLPREHRMTYYKLTPEFLTALNQSDLTYSEYRLLLYCLSKDPYQSTYVEFSTAEMLRACNFKSTGTLYTAMKKLRKQGLLSYTWDTGRFSTTPQKTDSTIAVEIDRSLQRSKYLCSDRTIAVEIQNQPESTLDNDSENRKSLKSLNRSKGDFDFENSAAPALGSPEYWQWINGAN